MIPGNCLIRRVSRCKTPRLSRGNSSVTAGLCLCANARGDAKTERIFYFPKTHIPREKHTDESSFGGSVRGATKKSFVAELFRSLHFSI